MRMASVSVQEKANIHLEFGDSTRSVIALGEDSKPLLHWRFIPSINGKPPLQSLDTDNVFFRFSMSENVSFTRRRGREFLSTTCKGAREGLLSSMGSEMLFKSTFLIPSFSTTRMFTNERFLASMNSSMNEKMSRSQEGFSTTRMGTSMGFSTLVMTSCMIHQISLRTKFAITSFYVTTKALLPTIHIKIAKVRECMACACEDFKRHKNTKIKPMMCCVYRQMKPKICVDEPLLWRF